MSSADLPARRADLLALTPTALASLTNMGLVKRAQKELEQGKVPALVIEADGTVVATFDDGAVSRLVPGKGLRDVPCSCGATTGCRHRLAAVFAYQQAAMAVVAAGDPATETVAALCTSQPWSPGDVDDTALVTLLGEGTVERAQKLRRLGYIAEVKRGADRGDDCPMVHLQTSSVRFLVRGDVGYARCDCTQKTGCLHVALAVWAFREKDRRDKDAAVLVVEVADSTVGGGSVVDARVRIALAATMDVVRLVIDEGVTRLTAASSGRIALAKDALTRANLAWPLLAVEELESLLEQYRRRSALFHPQRLRDVVIEIVARVRAGAVDSGGVVPARAVLGADEALSTKLDQARFIGLGATVEADGDDRRVRVLLADPGGQGIFVLERLFRKPDGGDVEDGAALGQRGTIGGASLAVLASGQMVSNAVTRQANRAITVGTGGLQKTSVTRGGFTLDRLPHDRVVVDVDAFIAARRARAPSFLRPRLVADDVDVVVVGSVDDVVWDPAAQAVIAVCRDENGAVVVVERRFKSVTKTATAALALAMSSAVQAVVGRVQIVGDLLVVEAIAVFTDRLIVLDLEKESPEANAAQAALSTGQKPEADSALAAAVSSVTTFLDEVLQLGVRTVSRSTLERGQRLAVRTREAGLGRVAADLEAFVQAATALSITGGDVDAVVAADRWADAALRASLVRDRV